MSFHLAHLPYSDTHSFSKLVTDYLSEEEKLKPFCNYNANLEGISRAIAAREQYPVNRRLLVSVLQEQYRNLPVSDQLAANITSLEQENTFTICTAHQPNLMTGYLYFVYKILHAIKLASVLKEQFPDKQFVPVYYMGSEDNDLEELGTFRYNHQKFTWDAAGQTGAVARMTTASLKPLLTELFRLLGPPGDHCEELKQMLTEAYEKQTTVGAATISLVNDLFGKYGLVVLEPDHAALKESFKTIMKEDLLQHRAHSIVSAQIAELSEHYKVQAHPRPINLFYLKADLRERIEKQGDEWVVVNTSIRWQEDQILNELNEHPECFSPNVILRGLYQETILPDVAFIGGGSEIAYWLQLKELFAHYHVFYPSLHLRQSVMWIGNKEKTLRTQLGLSIPEIFLPEMELVHQYIKNNSADEWQTSAEMAALENLLQQLKSKATKLDPTLASSAEAALTRIRHQVEVLEKKMLRAEKKKMQEKLSRISKLKESLFPNGGLQERVENFLPWYLQYGREYFDLLLRSINPLQHEFLVIEADE